MHTTDILGIVSDSTSFMVGNSILMAMPYDGIEQSLTAARKAVLDDREETHGTLTENFGQVSEFWSTYLGVEITEVDVAVMMVLMKASRQKAGTNKFDHYADMVGYSSIAAGFSDHD